MTNKASNTQLVPNLLCYHVIMKSKKSHKKLIITSVIVAVCLILAGIGAFFYLQADLYIIRYYEMSSPYEYRYIVKNTHVIMERRAYCERLGLCDGDVLETRDLGPQSELRNVFDPISKNLPEYENEIVLYDDLELDKVSYGDHSYAEFTDSDIDFIREFVKNHQ